MPVIIRNQWEGDLFPDAREDVDAYYSLKALDGAEFVDSDDVTGDETFRLKDGRLVTLYSVDLDRVEPREDGFLRALPIGAFAEVRWVKLHPEEETPEGTEEPAIFIFGDTEKELLVAGDLIERFYDNVVNLNQYVVIEVTRAEWDIAKRGQNINRGWQITDINLINFIYPWEQQ